MTGQAPECKQTYESQYAMEYTVFMNPGQVQAHIKELLLQLRKKHRNQNQKSLNYLEFQLPLAMLAR